MALLNNDTREMRQPDNITLNGSKETRETQTIVHGPVSREHSIDLKFAQTWGPGCKSLL